MALVSTQYWHQVHIHPRWESSEGVDVDVSSWKRGRREGDLWNLCSNVNRVSGRGQDLKRATEGGRNACLVTYSNMYTAHDLDSQTRRADKSCCQKTPCVSGN